MKICFLIVAFLGTAGEKQKQTKVSWIISFSPAQNVRSAPAEEHHETLDEFNKEFRKNDNLSPANKAKEAENLKEAEAEVDENNR